jgi:endonuclease/exonuclease/phosphatase (EEP) superfamily protein YafD
VNRDRSVTRSLRPPTPPPRPVRAARGVAIALGTLAIGTTVLSLRKSPHWLFRMWDFPRVQISTAAVAALALFTGTRRPNSWIERSFVAALLATLLQQGRKIAVYTPLWPAQVERSRGTGTARIRILMVNVLQENDRYDRLLEAIGRADPDVVLAVEIDRRWEAALEPLREVYPYVVRQSQENHYGMLLLSRIPLEDPRVEFVVQPDIPSIHARLRLPGCGPIDLYGLHPRPPEPLRNQDSAERDAELVIIGRLVSRKDPEVATIVAGDLNDVAWSQTTRLFLRLSKLLDPRIGRGFYNSYSAQVPLLRWPLDHVFHSDHFRLVELRRLSEVGSDHFPMLVELSYEPDARQTQVEPEADSEDAEEAERTVRDQRERDRSERSG